MASDKERRALKQDYTWTTTLYDLFPLTFLALTKLKYKETNYDTDNIDNN